MRRQKMRPCLLLLAAALGWVGLPPAESRGQGGYDPRAYQQFLTSPSRYRTYSRLSPGYGFQRVTPFGTQGYRQGPGYINERITPYGFEGYERVPGESDYTFT